MPTCTRPPRQYTPSTSPGFNPKSRQPVLSEHHQVNVHSMDPRSSDKDLTAAPQDHHAVRFAPEVVEIEPAVVDNSIPTTRVTAPIQGPATGRFDFRQEFPKERRLSHFHFEPVSLPASRTTSVEGSPTKEHHEDMMSSNASIRPHQAMQSPPLTPAGTAGYPDFPDKQLSPDPEKMPGLREPQMITPQHSSSVDEHSERTVTIRPKPTPHQGPRAHTGDGTDIRKSHRKGIFSLGGESNSGSASVSRDVSPSRASELYSRPVTPAAGDVDGPYAAKNRRQQLPHKRSVSPRFRFKDRSESPGASSSSHGNHGHHHGLRSSEKKHGATRPGDDATRTDSTRSFGKEHKTGSFATLKRFFKRAVSGETKREVSPPARKKASRKSPTSSSGETAPFSDDHLLESKYGKIDRVLGSGAGGSVMLMKRDDGRVFAVKEFRQRQSRESKRRYTKKITAEFCVASALHHSNIIETMDIVEVRDRWFQVMEFAPYDLFSIVMSGKMSREEVTCSWLQLLSGVTYLHSCGVAHRDLKLDNVVVTKGGIMKIIDFGSAHVFQYPHETAIQYAEGVVGSDPYMAPEVYDPNTKAYDPRASDIWSLGIIFCCMTLRRFPWRIPAASQDKSFRLFNSPPSPGHDPKHLLLHSKSSISLNKQPNGSESTPTSPESQARGRDGGASGDAKQRSQSQGPETAEKREVVSGPWRILRQIPRESRHIVWRMLEIDPKKRAKMEEIIRDPWVADTVICRETETGQVVQAPGHTHTLIEAATPASSPDAGKKHAV